MKLALIIAIILALIPVSVNAYVEINEIPLPHTRPFQSRAELSEWLEDYEPVLHFWGGVVFSQIDCEDYVIGMVMAAQRDGYLMLTDITKIDKDLHIWVAVPVFKENRWYFVESETREIYDTLNGKIVLID